MAWGGGGGDGNVVFVVYDFGKDKERPYLGAW